VIGDDDFSKDVIFAIIPLGSYDKIYMVSSDLGLETEEFVRQAISCFLEELLRGESYYTDLRRSTVKNIEDALNALNAE